MNLNHLMGLGLWAVTKNSYKWPTTSLAEHSGTHCCIVNMFAGDTQGMYNTPELCQSRGVVPLGITHITRWQQWSKCQISHYVRTPPHIIHTIFLQFSSLDTIYFLHGAVTFFSQIYIK